MLKLTLSIPTPRGKVRLKVMITGQFVALLALAWFLLG